MFARFFLHSWDQAVWRECRGWIPLQAGLAPAEFRSEYRPAWSRGGTEATPREWKVSGPPEVSLGEPSAPENVTLVPGCLLSGQSTAEAPSHPRTRVSLSQWQCCRPQPACMFSEGTGPRASGFTRLPRHGPLRAEASVSHGGAQTSGARPPLRGHPPLQVLLWVVLWWVPPWGPALLEPL